MTDNQNDDWLDSAPSTGSGRDIDEGEWESSPGEGAAPPPPPAWTVGTGAESPAAEAAPPEPAAPATPVLDRPAVEAALPEPGEPEAPALESPDAEAALPETPEAPAESAEQVPEDKAEADPWAAPAEPARSTTDDAFDRVPVTEAPSGGRDNTLLFVAGGCALLLVCVGCLALVGVGSAFFITNQETVSEGPIPGDPGLFDDGFVEPDPVVSPLPDTGLETPDAAGSGTGPEITGGGPISVGETNTGEITDSFAADQWSIELEEGQTILIEVRNIGEDTDPVLTVIDPDGNQAGYDDDGGEDRDSRLAFTALMSGIYTLRVEVFGLSTGPYQISVMDTADSPASQVCSGITPAALAGDPGEPGAITLNDAQVAVIEDSDAVHTWTYDGAVGEIIEVCVFAAEGSDVDPQLAVIGPDGEVLAQNDDAVDFNSRLLIELPEDGQYTFEVEVFGVTTGAYVISVEPGEQGDPDLIRP
ncbi:MAG: pre-peptidase C-terminal domain-containing protein [Anaerolineae bacterium]